MKPGRKRPRKHVRFVNGKAVVVNSDVLPQESSATFKYRVPLPVRQLAASSDTVVENSFNQVVSLVPKRFPARDKVTVSDTKFTSGTAGKEIRHLSFENCTFDGNFFVTCAFQDVNFSSCSFKDVTFDAISLGGVKFTDCDFNGATFDMIRLYGDLDFRGSNITKRQLDSFISDLEDYGDGDPETRFLSPFKIVYDKFSPERIVDEFDISDEELKVLLWVEDVEVRDNDTYTRVPISGFDTTLHHIPQWAVQELGLPKRKL